jgi:hypothetical protein
MQHHAVTPASTEENIHDDIDCWIDGVGVSIKTQHSGKKTGNIVMELKVKQRGTGVWEDSWFHNGKAVYYLITVGDKTYRIYADKLKEWLAIHGFDRTTQNSAATVANQSAIGHRHADSLIGLISITKLVTANIAEEMNYGNPPGIKVNQRHTSI